MHRFHDADAVPSSDHDPVVVGLDTGAADHRDRAVLGINDFHGRIDASGAEAGAAVLAGAVKQLRAASTRTRCSPRPAT